MDYAVRTTLLTKKYRGTSVVESVNLNVPKGSIYGLIGRNGAGKSTTLKLLAGLVEPSSGKIELLGSSSKKELRKVRRVTGALVESPYFFNNLDAFSNLEYYRILKGYPDKNVVKETMAIVGIGEESNKQYRFFSPGLKQKMGIALAVMGDPELVILDEPTNGLDPLSLIYFKDIVKRVNQSIGTTFIISNHVLEELSQLATHYGIMDDGRLIRESDSEELYNISRQSVELVVDKPSVAVRILDYLKCREYEVLNDNVIKVYDFAGENSEIVKAMVNSGVKLESIVKKKTSLSEYFNSVLGGRDA